MSLRGTLRGALVLVLVMSFSVPAMAQDEETNWDKYSVTSERVLMLTGQVKSSLSGSLMKKFYSQMAMGRFNFDIKGSNPNSAAVKAWCTKSVKDTQVRRDNTDEYGEAEVTLKAMVERCSQVFRYTLTVSHSCQRKTDKKGKKPRMACKVISTATFTKFKASMKGGFNYTLDTAWGKKGTIIMKSNHESSTSITKKVSAQKAQASALRSAASGAGFGYKLKIRGVKEFQTHAPIVRVKNGHADSCLGKDTVELDLPFHVVFKGRTGEKRKGFVKARRIYDGCTLTPSMVAAQKKGKKFKIRPMESQIIIGGSSVRKGYTLWEMPSSGLNLDFHAAMMPIVGDESTFGGGFGAEYNLASAVGVSELYTFLKIDIGFVSDTAPLSKMLNTAYGFSPDVESTLLAQLDYGVFKRIYMSRLFLDFGLAFSASYYAMGPVLINGFEEGKASVIGIGATPHLGVGFQISPRLMFRASGGYRYAVLMPMVTDSNDEEVVGINGSAPGFDDSEKGIRVDIGFQYTL